MDRLTSEVHFILNPDVIIHDNILPQMAQWLLDHPGVVMATPQLYFRMGASRTCRAASPPRGCCWPASWPRGLAV